MNIDQLKKELNITNKDIAEMFGFKNMMSYCNSSVKVTRYENGLCKFYELTKTKTNGSKM
jgi:hypothetical protein